LGEVARRGPRSHLHDHHMGDRIENRPAVDRVAQPIDSNVDRACIDPFGRYEEAACEGGLCDLAGHQRRHQAKGNSQPRFHAKGGWRVTDLRSRTKSSVCWPFRLANVEMKLKEIT